MNQDKDGSTSPAGTGPGPAAGVSVFRDGRESEARCPAAGAAARCGHGTLLLLFGLLLVLQVIMGVVFVADETPGTQAAWTGFPLDDAWIHMVYSRSLAESGVPCYNRGELENGFTSPLWMTLSALPHLAERLTGFPAVAGVKLLGVLFAWLAACAMLVLLLNEGCGVAAAVCGSLILCFQPAFGFAAVSGMEVSLTVFLMLAATLAFRRAAWLAAGILAALALAARPEAALLWVFLVGLLCLEYLAGWLRREEQDRRPPPVRAILLLAAPGLLLAGAWVAYSLAVAGSPLPNTFYVKRQAGGFLGGEDLREFVSIAIETAKDLHPAVAIAVVALALVGMARMSLRSTRGSVFPWLLFSFGAAFLLAVCATRDMPEGCTRYFYWWRYLVPGLPFLWIPAAFGLDTFFGQGSEPGGRLAKRAAAAAFGLMVLGGLLFGLAPAADKFAWNCQNINEVQVELGRWVNENVPEDSVVAVNDAGAIRYFGGRRTIDLGGLNRHEGIDEAMRGAAFPVVNAPKFVSVFRQVATGNAGPQVQALLIGEVWKKLAWLRERDADFLIVFPMWFPDVDIAAGQGWFLEPPGGRAAAAGRFVQIAERRSPYFTITEAPPPGQIGQDVKRAYRCEYAAAP